MLTLHSIILLLAFICFVLSALGVPSKYVNLQSAGLALWLGSILVR